VDGNGERGMFPSNYCEVITAGSTLAPERPSVGGRSFNGGRSEATTPAAVDDCSQCGCGDYRPNAFKAGQCVSCYHKH
jgi:hypothetical protein